jgi:hypothetical protein
MNNTSIFQALQCQCNTKYFNQMQPLDSMKYVINTASYLFCIILLPQFVLLYQYNLKLSFVTLALMLDQTNFPGIARVLLIFHSSVAIPIPRPHYCIAILNSKTC